MRRQLSSTTKTTNLTCLSKVSNVWTTSNCQQTYSSKQNLFSCVCDESHPTTITDNLENLILNKNLKTAFSGQGFSNISNWVNFYCYVAFWLLLSKTIAFIALLIYGKRLDARDMKLLSPVVSAKIFSLSSPEPSEKLSLNADEKKFKP